ncbi:MAG: glycerol-3-phosphate 1-O-acyltransferase PlsY [Acholeplasmataceae bacterium]
MTVVYMTLFFILSYILGSIPSGLIIGKVFRDIDIREHGSKNTGATNAIRVLGFKYGVWAFVFDILKGAFVIAILSFFKMESLYLIEPMEMNILMLYGAFAVLGHVWPIYINFKGGKAVATSAGVVTALAPWIALIVITVFFIMFFITRYVSKSSTMAAITALSMFVLRIFVDSSQNLATHLMNLFVISALATIIFIRHRANYKRLREGTEYRFDKKKTTA